MEGTQAKVAFSALLELHKHADVFNDVCCSADFLNLVVGDSHVKNLAKREMRNKEEMKEWNRQNAKKGQILFAYLGFVF